MIRSRLGTFIKNKVIISGINSFIVIKSNFTQNVRSSMQTTIVFPCYNEEKRLNKEAFLQFVEANDEFNLLFVDDGSTDNSLSILNEMKEACSDRIFIHALSKNSGKAEAVRQGLLKALEVGSPIVGYADTDLATPLYELKRLAEILDRSDYKVLMGSRVKMLGRKIKRKLMRHLLGRVFATFASVVLKLEVYDTQCGAKFFKCSKELNQALVNRFISKWIFDVELLKRLLDAKTIMVNDFYEEPVRQWIDVEGSKLNLLSMLRSIVDFIKIWLNSR